MHPAEGARRRRGRSEAGGAGLLGGGAPKPRRRHGKKLSAAAQLRQTREGRIDLETPDSILVNANLRALLNERTFDLLPQQYRLQLARLLPSVDRPGSAGRLGSSSLSNEFFARACLEWRNALHEGEFTPENQQKIKTEAERDKSRLDPWKLKHFEPVWGEKRLKARPPSPEPEPEPEPPAVVPEPAVAPVRRRIAGAVTRSSARAASDESKECKNKRGRPKSHYVDSAAFARSAWPVDDEVPPADPLRADSDSERSAKRRALQEDEPQVRPETEPKIQPEPDQDIHLKDVKIELKLEPELKPQPEIAEQPEPEPQIEEEAPPTPRPPTPPPPTPPPTEDPSEPKEPLSIPIEFDEPEDESESLSRQFVDAEPFAVESETNSKGELSERPFDLFDQSPSDRFDYNISDSPETRSSDDEAIQPQPEESVEPIPRNDPPPPDIKEENSQSFDNRLFISDAPLQQEPELSTIPQLTDVEICKVEAISSTAEASTELPPIVDVPPPTICSDFAALRPAGATFRPVVGIPSLKSAYANANSKPKTKSVTKESANRSRSNNKPPPGEINLERSYQICQAVIQNSPNRDQLRCQLKPPPSMLTNGSNPAAIKGQTATKPAPRRFTPPPLSAIPATVKPQTAPVVFRHVYNQGIPVNMAVLQHPEMIENRTGNIGQYILVQRTSGVAPRASSAPPSNDANLIQMCVSNKLQSRPASATESQNLDDAPLQSHSPSPATQAVSRRPTCYADDSHFLATVDPMHCADASVYPNAQEESLPGESACVCHLRPMVACKKCGAFNHEDCMSPSKLCGRC